MEQLCHSKNTEATKIVASVIPKKIYYSDPMISLIIDLLYDMLLELMKFINISESSKKINISINRLRDR